MRIGGFLLIAVVAAVVQLAAGIVMSLVMVESIHHSIVNFNVDTGSYISPSRFYWLWAIICVIGILVVVVSAAFYTRLALSGVDDDGAGAATITRRATTRFWPFAGWVALGGACISVGLGLAVIPGLVAVFFLLFVPYFAAERPNDRNAFSASGRFSLDHPGAVVVLMLVGIGILIVIIVISVGVVKVVDAIFGEPSSVGSGIGYFVTWLVGFIGFGYFLTSAAALYRLANLSPGVEVEE